MKDAEFPYKLDIIHIANSCDTVMEFAIQLMKLYSKVRSTTGSAATTMEESLNEEYCINIYKGAIASFTIL